MTKKIVSDYVEDMAATMLATTQGIDLNPDTAYNERKEIYQAKGLVVHTRATVQTVEGDKNGLWTTAVAAAVLVALGAVGSAVGEGVEGAAVGLTLPAIVGSTWS